MINQLSGQVEDLTERIETQSKNESQLSIKQYIANEFSVLDVGKIKQGGKIYLLPDESSEVFIEVTESSLDVKVYYILDNGWALVQNDLGSPLGYCREDVLLPIEGELSIKLGTINFSGIVYLNENNSSSFIYSYFNERIETAIFRGSMMEVFGYHNSEDISELLGDLINSYIFTISEDEYLEIYYREDERLVIMEYFILRTTKYML